jgi:hypothetical protein
LLVEGSFEHNRASTGLARTGGWRIDDQQASRQLFQNRNDAAVIILPRLKPGPVGDQFGAAELRAFEKRSVVISQNKGLKLT